MKSTIVRLRKCGTCSQQVYAYINDHSFLTELGQDKSVVRVEGHCGRPGHATRVAHIGKDEFDKASNGDTI